MVSDNDGCPVPSMRRGSLGLVQRLPAGNPAHVALHGLEPDMWGRARKGKLDPRRRGRPNDGHSKGGKTAHGAWFWALAWNSTPFAAASRRTSKAEPKKSSALRFISKAALSIRSELLETHGDCHLFCPLLLKPSARKSLQPEFSQKFPSGSGLGRTASGLGGRV